MRVGCRFVALWRRLRCRLDARSMQVGWQVGAQRNRKGCATGETAGAHLAQYAPWMRRGAAAAHESSSTVQLRVSERMPIAGLAGGTASNQVAREKYTHVYRNVNSRASRPP